MNFYIVFCKTRKKFEKYIKVNRIRNKVIIDIKDQLEQEEIDYEDYKEYFDVIIYTKIIHAFKKGKDVYYIPNFEKENIDIKEIFKVSNTIKNSDIKYNVLFFHDEFKNDNHINNSIIENIDKFNTSQIIKDY